MNWLASGLRLPFFLSLAALCLLSQAAWSAGVALSPDQKCIAMVTYAEAAGEGEGGQRAVIQVIRNRMNDPRFAKSGCEVVRAPGEFQPVTMSKRLRDALATPETADMASALADFGVDRAVLMQVSRLVAAGPDRVASTKSVPAVDATEGALFFVNPRLMDPSKCAWFAKLKRTASIGGHVFMTSYGPDEPNMGPALDCAQVAKDWAAFQKANPMRATAALRGRKRRAVNPAWIVPVDHSVMAEGGSCSTGTYDAGTRTYRRGNC
jgi:hypothetical protein